MAAIPDAAPSARERVRRRLDEDGFVVIPMLDADVVDSLLERFATLGVDPETPRFVSAVHLDRAAGSAIDRWLADQVGGLVRERLVDLLGTDLRTFLCAYFAKGAHHGERMHYHQDWTYTDERTAESVLTWIPLVDVDAHNGAMAVIPGSHRWSRGIRASNIDADPPTDAHLDSFDRRAIPLDLRAGEALVYHPALVHGTPPNRTDRTRPVVGLAFAPVGVPVVHFRRDDDGNVHGTEVPPGSFYMDAFTQQLDAPTPYPAWTGLVDAADFEPHLVG